MADVFTPPGLFPQLMLLHHKCRAPLHVGATLDDGSVFTPALLFPHLMLQHHKCRTPLHVGATLDDGTRLYTPPSFPALNASTTSYMQFPSLPLS
jgi:hypothetical protein